jgi:cytochrome b561
MQQFDASMHFGLYGTIILQATLGFIASSLTLSVAALHVIGSNVILITVALHFRAAVRHTLIASDETLDRMITPRSDQPMTWTVNNAKTV